jgi:ATP-dependent DNA helicase HFM1/MER3
LAQGRTIIESCLHRNLSEHLNSEIGLGTITDIDSAKTWLRNSFLFQRIQKNPKHYSLGKGYHQTWEEKIDDMVVENITKLQKTELVAYTNDGETGLKSTDYGDIMSKVSPSSLHVSTLMTSIPVLHTTING